MRPFRPLTGRVLAWVVLYSTIFTFVMTAVLIGVHYLDERGKALKQLQFAADNYRGSLANSLWELDMPSVRLQLKALAHFALVGRAVLKTGIGETLEAGNKASASDALSWKETLRSPEHPDRPVGQLELYIDHRAFLGEIESSAFQILAGEALKGLALALLLAWLITRLVTRHVAQMAQQVEALEPVALGRGLTLSRPPSRHEDELDRLCDAFNHLNRRVAHHIATQARLETELLDHQETLSQKVAERTTSLERLKGFHGLIIRVLTGFINLPPTETEAAVDRGLASFGEYFGASRCLLLGQDESLRGFRIANAWPPEDDGHGRDFRLANEMLLHCVQGELGSRIWISAAAGSADGDPHLRALTGAAAFTLVGVDVQGRTAGLLCLIGCAIAVDSDGAALLELAARVAVNMLDHKAAQASLLETQKALRQANRELLVLSRRDALTGLANRRHFDEIKDAEFRRATRANLPLSVLMCDIDQFKQYNDTYGHMQGDRCLRSLAACIVRLFGRAGELPARMGGEEFAILLPDTDRDEAYGQAERLRQAVVEMNLPHATSSVAMRVTVSIGVASLRHGVHEDFDAILHEADQALYLAKEGRNQTVMAG